jgi:nucleotide-binding universal stress UspA family protein
MRRRGTAGDDRIADHEEAPMKKILIGYDATPESERALDRTADLAIAFGAEVIVISVARALTPAGRGVGPVDPTDPMEAHEELVAQAAGRLEKLGVEAERVTALGQPARTIVEAAEGRGVDLIVLGARDLNVLERLVAGSVSDAVVHRAPCDVLIVH